MLMEQPPLDRPTPRDTPLTGTDPSHESLAGDNTQQQIRVLCVDDHPVMRQGIGAVIRASPDMALIAEACDGLEAIVQFRRHQPDVTLIDVQMPNMNGLDAMLAIRSEAPQARFIVFSMFQGDALARSALRAGASGYLPKNALMTDLLQAIRATHAGERYIPAEIAHSLAEHSEDRPLSDREIEVLQCVARLSANRLIAKCLGIAEETVKVHMKNIIAKLGASDRTNAIVIAIQRGLISV